MTGHGCLLWLTFTHIFLLGFVVDSVVGFTLTGGEVGPTEGMNGAIVCCGCAACVDEDAIAVIATTVDDVVGDGDSAVRLWPEASVNGTKIPHHKNKILVRGNVRVF